MNLQKIQTDLKCNKGQYNSFGKYSYRSCEDILEAVKPLLAANGCSLTLSDDIICVGERIYVKATARLSDDKTSVETTAYAREEETKKGMDGAQVTGAASSYARKYALNGLFCIDDTKDADATNHHGKDEPQDYEAENIQPDMLTKEQPKEKMASPNQVKIMGAYPEVTQNWIAEKYHINTFDELTAKEATKIIKVCNAAKKKAEEGEKK